MSIEQQLAGLFDELADDHIVGPPPTLEHHVAQAASRPPARPARRAVAAVAACLVVLIGGLVAIGTRNDDPAPANPLTTTLPSSDDPQSDGSVTSTPAPDPTAAGTTDDAGAVETGGPRLVLVRIDATASEHGTTAVVLVFDGDVPSDVVERLANPATAPSDRIGWLTQTSPDGISVCGNTHGFPPPGNRTVDIFVPSSWFVPEASYDAPIEWSPDSVTEPKIVVCQPQNGAVQVSVWGAASGRLEDVDVSVSADTIVVDISPDPAASVVGATGAVDGPVMRHPNPNRSESQEGLAAEVRGVLELEDDCLYVSLGEVGDRYPILWPASTKWNPDTNAVELPSGESVTIGQSVYGGGGYMSVEDIERLAGSDAAELAERCVDNQYGEIAVVNNNDSAIRPD